MKANMTDEVNKIKFIDKDYCEKFVYVQNGSVLCMWLWWWLWLCASADVCWSVHNEVSLVDRSNWMKEKGKGKERWQVE